MKTTFVLLVSSVAFVAASPTRFDVEYQRAAINARVEMLPGDPSLFNRPAPLLPVESPQEILRRLRSEILGTKAGFAPHPASGFGMKLSSLAKRQAKDGFEAVRQDYIATFRALKAWLDANPAQ